jgi:DNA-binding NtrC family response regulator
MRKHTYARRQDVERLAFRMQKTGILCSEGVREFKKQFIIAALKAAKGNRTIAAEVLGMHINTLARNIRALDIDVSAVSSSKRHSPKPAAMPNYEKRSA